MTEIKTILIWGEDQFNAIKNRVRQLDPKGLTYHITKTKTSEDIKDILSKGQAFDVILLASAKNTIHTNEFVEYIKTVAPTTPILLSTLYTSDKNTNDMLPILKKQLHLNNF